MNTNQRPAPAGDADQVIEDYLRWLRAAARGLPRKHREDLLAQVDGHIAEARAAGEASTEVGARNLLETLGDPGQLVAAARAELPLPPGPRLGGREITATILLLFGGWIFFVGWVVGAVLLWASPYWSTRDKVLGTFIWPLGLVFPVSVGAGAALNMPTWAMITLVALVLLAEIATTIRLIAHARAPLPVTPYPQLG